MAPVKTVPIARQVAEEEILPRNIDRQEGWGPLPKTNS